MKRRILGVGLFCLVLFAAILAGYWDMLSTEKLKLVRDGASQKVGEIADIVRKDPNAADTALSDTAKVETSQGGATGKEGRPSPAAAPASANADADAADQATATPPRDASIIAPQSLSPKGAAPAAADAGLPAGGAPVGATGDGPAEAASEAQPGISPAAPMAVTAATPAAPAKPKAANGTMALPTFDVVRVEPDGSTVLAGRAPAGSTVALLDGKTRIGGDTASAGGDFVVALDERLAIGEHQLTLEATGPDGRAATSAETAIVSIPQKGRENELLAMVESPDHPSRLISIPSAPSLAAATPPAPAEGDAATAASQPPAPPTDGAAVLPMATPPAAATAEVTVPAAPAPALAKAPKATATALSVEAVEIEGDQVYIAGRASGATSVRAYIDNGFLAAAPSLRVDRFLITATASVSPGDHLVRADALDAAGAVVARVEVPFNRPEGQDMAAISRPAAPGKATTVPENSPTESTAPGGAGSVAAETAAAPKPQSPETASTDTTARLPAPGAAPAQPAPEASSASASVAAAQPPASGVDPATVAPEASSTTAEAAATDGQSDPATSASATPGSADAGRPPAEAGVSGDDIAVIRQQPLETVGSRVIIRRGDTLWRISRDTYGRGARYTVIYLANGDQIRDPDLIYPGQVFRTPEDTEASTSPPATVQ